MTDDFVKLLRSPYGPFNWEDAVANQRKAADRIEKLEASLQRIASCESHHPDDVVAIARKALEGKDD
jgi:hypothetical protein